MRCDCKYKGCIGTSLPSAGQKPCIYKNLRSKLHIFYTGSEGFYIEGPAADLEDPAYIAFRNTQLLKDV